MEFETKYRTLLELVISQQRLERKLKSQYSSTDTAALKRLKEKIAVIVNDEVGKAIQIQQKMFG